ncbi:response regulator [Catenuloplanes atrovinosus]|uniref:HD-like signal output (HDOD) protein/CheY-like chemotaxis protein n=1 Tax=Catenuloplanes atrovinosus TaxID=137266 RepID=A0AAE4C8A6_9ACTN|nr:response regulator [Catenuloplanes atrovinosus]MDR7275321.1 HD-like signal output (HDOD) protein/CheY-like chemotaxis protein [Catenuloplanes atrovinosus]
MDDEPRILDGLRRSLRVKRDEWDMSFADGGEPALEALAADPYDVVVSDMRMPGMDGAQLLAEVSRRHPEVARVVLSGHTERESAIKAAIAGHRFLSKPTEADVVIDVVGQLIVRTSAAHGRRARRIAGAVRWLPALPRQDAELAGLLGAAEVDHDRVIDAVVQHIWLSAKLLQLSNSGFLGSRSKNASIAAVIGAMGVSTIQGLFGAASAQDAPVGWTPATEAYVRTVWRHAVATALLVEQVASPAHRPYAQAAALLQDVGRLAALNGDAPDPAAAGHDGLPFRDVGVELLHLWGLPAPIVTAVAERDLPHEPAESGLGVTGALRTAHLLVQQTDARDPSAGRRDDELARLLAHPQLAVRDTDWRRAAQAASTRAGDRFETR